MQIVIDIPEKDYRWIKEHKGVTDYQITQMLYNRVRKGISLPKGHGRLIDADTTIQKLGDDNEDAYAEFVLNDAPTVVEAEREDNK